MMAVLTASGAARSRPANRCSAGSQRKTRTEISRPLPEPRRRRGLCEPPRCFTFLSLQLTSLVTRVGGSAVASCTAQSVLAGSKGHGHSFLSAHGQAWSNLGLRPFQWRMDHVAASLLASPPVTFHMETHQPIRTSRDKAALECHPKRFFLSCILLLIIQKSTRECSTTNGLQSSCTALVYFCVVADCKNIKLLAAVLQVATRK